LARVWAPAVLSAAVGVAILFAVFGHLLPDTSIAKRVRGLPVNVPMTARYVLGAHAASSGFGAGLLALWLATLFAAMRGCGARERIRVLAVNASWPVFVVLLAISHQAIHGVRYFVFLEVFLISWNMANASDAPLPAFRRPWLLALAPLAAWFAADAFLARRVVASYESVYEEFTHANLSPLAGRTGIGGDIGFAGYFTQGRILDMAGLVNGRAVAAMTLAERLRVFTTEPVAFAFLDEEQRKDLNAALPTDDWPAVLHIDPRNVSSPPDRHWLFVRPDIAAAFPSDGPNRPHLVPMH
jgi:hypothetical protein